MKRAKAIGLLTLITGGLVLSGCGETKEENTKAETVSQSDEADKKQEEEKAEKFAVTESPEESPNPESTEKVAETTEEKSEEERTEEEKNGPKVIEEEPTKDEPETAEESVQEEEDAPSSPAEEAMEEESVMVGDPTDAESQINIEIKGIKDTEGAKILKELKDYGFIVEEGLEAPDGSVIWTQQAEGYSCDMQADPAGNIYNAIFTVAGEDSKKFFEDCAEAFSSEAAKWVKENGDADKTETIGEITVAISEGPMGRSLQICSADYSSSLAGPQ